ncbi:MAG: hypothetical protein ACK59Y_00905 [Betaproteobacteria bacterium]|jgi:hypothetical protein|nr:hypothetical protein [Betaproteobacteria bacterium]
MAKFDLSKLKPPKFGGRKKTQEPAPAPVVAADDGGRRKKIAMGAVAAVTVAIIGWMGWDAFMAEPPPPPPPPVAAKPKPPAEVPPEKLVDQLLEVSGLSRQLAQIPEQAKMGARQSAVKSADAAVTAEIEKIVAESFKAERYQQRVREALTKDFERKRIESLNKAFAAPQVKKIVEIESKPMNGEELAAFAKEVSKKPLSAERVKLLSDFADTTRSHEFLVALFIGTARAMMIGIVGGDAAAMKKFDADLEKNKAALMQGLRGMVLTISAFVYREVPDAELAEYAKLYESEDAKWMVAKVMNAIIEETRVSAEPAGIKIAEMGKARKGGAATVKAPTAAGAAGPAPMLTARARLDARECLKFDTNQAVHRCAERFR